MPVVVVEPAGERIEALLVGSVFLGVGPFVDQGLVEAFRFAVGLGPVGAGAEVMDPSVGEGLLETREMR